MLMQAFKRIGFLLNAEERTAGIAFTDKAIYCALRKQEFSSEPAIIVTRKLPENTIVRGVIVNHEVLAQELEHVLRELHTPVAFANISLPSMLLYTTLVHIPKTNKRSEYDKALELLLEVELPWKKNTSYTDYIFSENEHDVVATVFSIPRELADSYLRVAERAGVEVVSLEGDAMSTARLLESKQEPLLTVTASESSANIIIVKNNVVLYLLQLPIERIPDESKVTSEATHVKDFYCQETGTTILGDSILPLTLSAEAKIQLGDFADRMSVYPALGAALRKRTPTNTAREISLLSLRADELYDYQRLSSGLLLLRQATIATGLILIGAHLLLIQILASVAQQNSGRAITAPHLYANIAAIDKEAGVLNGLIAVGDTIGSSVRRYSAALALIDHIATDGITLTAIDTGSTNGPITISGIAATRNQYNFFRTNIVNTPQITVQSFPLGNLETASAIPFSLTVQIK